MDKKDIKSKLRSALQVLNESNLNRILSKHYQDGFIIITAYRGENDKATNEAAFKDLKNIIRSKGYSFIPVYGGFIENKGTPEEVEVSEPALIVPNHKVGTAEPYGDSEALKALGVALCQKYNQDSVLYKPQGNNSIAYYLDKSGNVDMEFNNKSINDLTQIYFTKLSNSKNPDKADRRFTLSFDQPPASVSEANSRYGEQFFSL